MCSRNCGCSIWLTISTFVAIIVAGLFFLGLLPSFQTALFIILAIAVISLFFLINCLNSCCTRQECFEEYGVCILAGAIGSIISSVLALSFTLTTGSILSAILVGLAAFFFILTLVSTIGLIICLLNANSRSGEGENGCGCGCSNNGTARAAIPVSVINGSNECFCNNNDLSLANISNNSCGCNNNNVSLANINNGNGCGCSNNNNSIATVANVVNNNGNNNGCNCGCRRCRYINR